MGMWRGRGYGWAILLTGIALGGCTTGRMRGFDALASSPGLEALALTDLPLSDKGDFRLGAASGTVEWRMGSDAVGWGPDGFGPPADQVRVGQVARFGVYAFDLIGGAMQDRLKARCRYGRTETRNRLFAFDIAAAGRPLRLQCVYRQDGREAGMLQLSAMPPRDGLADPRQGMIRFAGQDLLLRSDHGMEGIGGQTESPMGYRLTTPDGRIVAVVETNGLRSRRLLLSRDPALRPAALAAALSLALFRDPGDTD